MRDRIIRHSLAMRSKGNPARSLGQVLVQLRRDLSQPFANPAGKARKVRVSAPPPRKKKQTGGSSHSKRPGLQKNKEGKHLTT